MRYIMITLLVLFMSCGGSNTSGQTTSDNNTDNGTETTGGTDSTSNDVAQGSMDTLVFGVSTFQ